MTKLLAPFGALAVVLLLAGCEKEQTAKPLPTPPRITQFKADKTHLNPGEAVTLSWSAENATQVEVLSDAGEKLSIQGDAHEGSATATPAKTAFYVLRVSGEGGRDSAFVQVAVGEDLKSTFLVAVPSVVDSGEPVQLLWSAFRAKSAVLRGSDGSEVTLDGSAGTGIVDVTPARSVAYDLTASGADEQVQLHSVAQVTVNPVVAGFGVAPAVAKAGETMTLSWTTRGAQEVTLSEATFGVLKTAAFPAEAADVDQGSIDFTVPATLPNGGAVTDGLPLRFTLTVKQTVPEVTLTRTVDSYVGEGPQIVEFLAPVAVTGGQNFTLSWRCANVEKLQVWGGGGLMFEPLPQNTAQLASGNITLKAPLADTTYELRVWGHGDVAAQASKLVKLVQPPVITAFTVPQMVAAPGSPAQASWTTTGATQVVLRVKKGPSLYATGDAAKVASGTADLYPGARTTFVLAAYNDAGDSVMKEATVDVAAPGTIQVSPSPVLSGSSIDVSWAVDPSITSLLVGDPTQAPVVNNPATDWYELEGHTLAKTVSFADPGDGTAKLELDLPFSFPLAGQAMREFWVGVNGFVSATDPGALQTNQDLATAGAPSLIAPFWDDLAVGQGQVLYYLDGTQFPRRLVVQWNKVKLAAEEVSELTFQVSLFETGEMRFAYKTLQGSTANGQSATVGFKSDTGASQVKVFDQSSLVEGDEEVWFVSTPFTGQYTLTAQKSATFALFGKLQAGGWVVYPASLNAIAPGAVVVNEAMLLPDATAVAGKWVELRNVSDADVDLSGTTLTTSAVPSTFVLPQGTVLAPEQYLVLGDSVDPLENGGAAVTMDWDALTPDGTLDDGITLSANQPISMMTWTAGGPQAGVSLQSKDLAIDSTGAALTCTRVKTFGANGAIGTPGAANETCFEYSLTPIPVAFRDISTSGTPVFPFTASDIDSEHEAVSIAAHPFPFFGQPSTSLDISSNGLVGVSESLSSSMNGNDTEPTTDPQGVVAPFWDDLDSDHSGNGTVLYERIAPGQDPMAPAGHWIVQWHHMTYWLSSPDDDLNFQVKLFDNGIIEFHYATMHSGTSSNKANGNGATEWISRPTGDAALPIGIEQPVISSNTAYRFTPNP